MIQDTVSFYVLVTMSFLFLVTLQDYLTITIDRNILLECLIMDLYNFFIEQLNYQHFSFFIHFFIFNAFLFRNVYVRGETVGCDEWNWIFSSGKNTTHIHRADSMSSSVICCEGTRSIINRGYPIKHITIAKGRTYIRIIFYKSAC